MQASPLRQSGISIQHRSKQTLPEAAIERLTSKQRAHLRSLAHELDPAVHIGKDGVNAATLKTTKEAFNTRELLKIRVLENAPEEARATGQALADQIEDAQVVHATGRVVVLYRPDPDKPTIRLP